MASQKMNDEAATAWFKQVVESVAERGPIRIAVEDEDGNWLPREEFIVTTGIDDEIYRHYVLALPSSNEPTTRYMLRFEDGDLTIDDRYRYRFTISGFRDGDTEMEELDPDERDTNIVIEFPERVDPAHFQQDETDLEFSAEMLKKIDDTDHFEPVGADRVAGLAEEKQRLTTFLNTSNEEWGLESETGIILEGPPGTGKTELVMEVCQEQFGTMPVMISGPEILSKWVGESERLLRQKFEEARESDHCVLYIDELDAIARARSEASEDYSAQIVAQLLVLLDGVEAKQEQEQQPLKVIASTNLSHVVDPALRRPGRLGSRPIQFDRPTREDRTAILHHYLEKIHARRPEKLGPELRSFVTGENLSGVVSEIMGSLVGEMEGFTGADVEDVVQEAVSSVQEQGGDKLELTALQTILVEEFTPSRDYRSVELAAAELGSDSRFELNPGVPVVELAMDEPTSDDRVAVAEEIAESHFSRIFDDTAEAPQLKFRVVGPGDLLDSDPMRAEENTVEVFQHSKNEHVCVYLKNVEYLMRAERRSSLVGRLMGVINEQVLQWDGENLLIVDAVDGEDWLVTLPTQQIEV